MKIGSCVSKRGKISKGSLTVCKYKGKSIRIPIIIAEGLEGHKKVFISGGMHGNELNGVETLQRFYHDFDVKKLKGTIVFIPVLNTSGYYNEMREVEYDKSDLNRSFVKGNKVSHKIAKVVMDEVVRKCDFGIDLHDSGTDNVLIPHVRVHAGSDKKVCRDGCTINLGSMFGTELVLERNGLKGMLAIEAYQQYKIPVLTVEIGGAMIIWDKYVDIGVTGIKNLLKYNGMLDGKLILPRKQYVMHQLDIIRKGYRSKFEGIFIPKKELGKYIRKKDMIAEIHDPINERTQKLIARENSILFSMKMLNKIEKNEVALTALKLNDKDFKIINNSKNKDVLLRKNRVKL
ncbi:hypothetical protein CL617_01720 [archaeon]|nr:hypothetical protein [archaeon]|tara:strand:- start:1267 stop:2304 length:1038 start_codon:yes stop_codon:yes gene_type:complete